MTLEIRNRVKEKLGDMVLHLTYDEYLSAQDTEEILSISELAVVDRDAKCPVRRKPESRSYTEPRERDIYLQGQLDAQGDMIKGNWVKEVKD